MINEHAYDLGANGCCIRELHAYGVSRAAIVGAENVFDFTIGSPSTPTPPEINQTIRDILTDTDDLVIHGYTSDAGDLAARKAIAEDLSKRFRISVTAEELFLGCGAAPELVAVCRALAVPGSRILAIAPFFPEYRPFVEQAGAEFQVVPADIPDFQINLKAMEQLLTENTVAVIVNSPNNPSGAVYSEKTLKNLGKLLQEKEKQYGHPIYIIADEPYRELAYGVEVPFIPKLYDNTVVCYSYSKSLSLPGERVGYIYVPKAAADSKKLYTAIAGGARAIGHICAPSLMQKVLARCAHLRPDLTDYDRNRRALYEGLTKDGYQVAKPEGAFYLFVKAPGGDSQAFCEKAKALDLLVVPGDDFGCPEYFRLCYCVSYDKVQRSIPLFEKLL